MRNDFLDQLNIYKVLIHERYMAEMMNLFMAKLKIDVSYLQPPIVHNKP